jgi:hypothetical protein
MSYFRHLGLEFDKDNRETRAEKERILEANQKEIRERIAKFHSYDKIEKSFYNTANDFKRLENYS